jgi:hypothetical protein
MIAMDKIVLPPSHSGECATVEADCKCLLIIGANGAGKTRFASRVVADLGERAYCLSALDAIYGPRPSAHHDTFVPLTPAVLYCKMVAAEPMIARSLPESASDLERVMAMLMLDEMLNLISYKIDTAHGEHKPLGHTRLDSVIAMWKDLFPGNDVLIEGGKLLFARKEDDGDTSSRSSLRLSAGEKVVLYYFGAVQYAPQGAVITVDSPDMFLHPSIIRRVWDKIESTRPDCTFVYVTHDPDFASSRSDATICWVRSFDATNLTWDYDLLPPHTVLSDELYLTLLGARKPVLFIEGDEQHSIDSKLYPLIFPNHTVKALGSCNRVIESTRTFNNLQAFHHLDSYGIVDRDRRSAQEVAYLRDKKILVPEVAEIENILMLEGVIRAVAQAQGYDPSDVFAHVKRAVIDMFAKELKQQALLHTRHYVKHTVEHRIDRRFHNITKLEEHLTDLVYEINPRVIYDNFCNEFHGYVKAGDYAAILLVYNQKSMLPCSGVASACGLADKRAYIDTILALLKSTRPEADMIRKAVMDCFGLGGVQ